MPAATDERRHDADDDGLGDQAAEHLLPTGTDRPQQRVSRWRWATMIENVL
jgi:hypothetical protein